MTELIQWLTMIYINPYAFPFNGLLNFPHFRKYFKILKRFHFFGLSEKRSRWSHHTAASDLLTSDLNAFIIRPIILLCLSSFQICATTIFFIWSVPIHFEIDTYDKHSFNVTHNANISMEMLIKQNYRNFSIQINALSLTNNFSKRKQFRIFLLLFIFSIRQAGDLNDKQFNIYLKLRSTKTSLVGNLKLRQNCHEHDSRAELCACIEAYAEVHNWDNIRFFLNETSKTSCTSTSHKYLQCCEEIVL